jgi:orotate phosphoribosyltransferase
VVDREQGGGEILEGEGCPVHSLYQVSGLIDYYETTGRIGAATAEAARKHVQKRRFC